VRQPSTPDAPKIPDKGETSQLTRAELLPRDTEPHPRPWSYQG
jgi:hypothetical protein